MTSAFQFSVAQDWTELRLPGKSGFIPVDFWAIEAPEGALVGVDLVQRLIASNSAIAEGDVALIEHAAIAALSVREANQIGLPPLAAVVAEIRFLGLITSPNFSVHLTWKRPNGQNIVGAKQTGAWLLFGGARYRLPDALFAIGEAVNQVAAAGDIIGDRLTAIATLREVLPPAQADGTAHPQGLAGTLRIAVADSFSLDLKGDGADAMLVPILHRTGGDADSPMLDPQQQAAFGEDQFNRFSSARSVYTLHGNTYVILAPPLRRALDVVRSAQTAPLATKRSLFRSPRAFLRDVLGDDVEDTVIESLFRETAAYSDRVVGLGLWEPRVVPWVPLPRTDWLGGEMVSETEPASGRAAERGLMIGDRCVPLDEAAIGDLRARVETAIGSGIRSVQLETDGETIDVPATHETLAAIHMLEGAQSSKATKPPSDAPPEVLIIHPNEEMVGLEASFLPRSASPAGIPACVTARLKPHQTDGVEWLQRAWAAGAPGVLLADDMGLGKTLQGLTFLAWLRNGMQTGIIERAPVLIVAPTGLLENWIKEHSIHLAAPGLGTCVQAYGRSLAVLRCVGPNGVPTLDLDALAAADWVLTTYETLRDHDRDFGLVQFAAILFDEAQKIKNPGVRITDAAKAMKAGFRIAMTGTPVENRLSDLWCIVDGVHPGFLDDLKAFSTRYEASHDPEALRGLKRDLERPLAGRPSLMLRRMKYDHLLDLPQHQEVRHETLMPEPQAEAYRAAIEIARHADRRGAVLEALQRLRAISLHPGGYDDEGDDHFINVSARLIASFEILNDIHRRGERVLIFVEDLELQPRLASIIQRRYRLPAPPLLINGQVSGSTRQARVDRFQQAPDGFDAMILSARAGGVGLTLTRANHVIHLSRWWNPAVEDQCTGRVLRIGQTRPVLIHVPLAVLPNGGRSFDQNLQALLERKRNLMRAALIPTDETDGEHREVLDACLSM
jgi:hypothetical protein